MNPPETPEFPTRGCGYRVTFWGANMELVQDGGCPAAHWPVEITDTHTGEVVVRVLTVVEARQLAFDLLAAALHAEDARKANVTA